ncbi:MAG: signal peptidase I [Oscillospiraceae bacterium]
MADLDESKELQADDKSAQKTVRMKKEIWEWAKSLFWAILLVFLVFQFVIKPVQVSGSSMEPTLHNDDRLIVYQLLYEPKQGDVVILDENSGLNEALVKRVIAVGGQTVDIDVDGNVWVDGKQLQEDYIQEQISDEMRGNQDFPVTVPPKHIFVMGDNRNHSTDSRDRRVGCVDTKDVVGKVVLRILPFDKIGLIHS